jgi:hypothetical protein
MSAPWAFLGLLNHFGLGPATQQADSPRLMKDIGGVHQGKLGRCKLTNTVSAAGPTCTAPAGQRCA